MSVLVGLAAIWAQEAGGALSSVESWPWIRRVESSLVAYAAYCGDFFWPTRLAVFYPHSLQGVGGLRVFLSAALVAALLVIGVRGVIRREPVGVGILWFLGTMLPVIGIVTVGEQARADRYTYIPSVGLAIAVVWGVPPRWSDRLAVRGGVVAALIGCVAMTRLLLPHWRSDETLFARALAVTSGNHVAHLNYGNAIEDPGRRAEQREHFERAIALDPNEALAYYDLGRIDALEGETGAGRRPVPPGPRARS